MNQKVLVNSEEFKPMIEDPENGFFQWIKNGYDAIQKGLDTDKVIVVCGRERKGKSTLVLRIVHKLNPNFDIENICFKGKQFRRRSKQIKKDILIIDEGGNVLYSGDTMAKDSKKTIQRIMEMGHNNNITFILIPNFFSLNKDIRERRVGGLIHITNRGRFYTYDEKAAIKIGKKKEWKAAKPSGCGRWNHTNSSLGFEELWKSYKKREDHFKNMPDEEDEEDEVVKKIDKPKEIKKEIVFRLYNEGMDIKKIAKVVGYCRQTVSEWINES